MESTTMRDDDAGNGVHVDRVREFLTQHGLAGGDTEARDDRIFYAGLTCIELSMRPYERRLLRRAAHDAERVDAMLRELHGELPSVPEQDVLTPAVYREFVNVIERDLHPEGEGGPVPALFRTGAFLIAASYNPTDPTIGRCAQRDILRLKAALEFLEDLLDWVEAGRRGDRLETLEEARSRMEAIDQQVAGHYDALRGDIQRFSDMLEAARGTSLEPPTGLMEAVNDSGERIASVESALAGVSERLAKVESIDRQVSALSEQIAGVQARVEDADQASDRRISDLARQLDGVSDSAPDAIAQLRPLVLINLAGIAVVGILVIVAISVS